MQRQLLNKLSWRAVNGFAQFTQRRAMHDRNKKAMELIAKGWSALKEVDRVIDYCELNDRRLIPLLRAAKDNFELALETDNSNTHARASEKGHAGAAIAYGSLLLQGVEVPESVMNLTSKRGSLARKARKNAESLVRDQAGMARERFQIAAKAGCDLGLKWLERLDEEEKHLLTENAMVENAQGGKKVC